MTDFRLERPLWQKGLAKVAGVDEAGRGPLAGPVVAAAVILTPKWQSSIPLADSKKLSASQREILTTEIKKQALAWSVRLASPSEIDRINILKATLMAMERAIASLVIPPDYVLVDGNQPPCVPYPLKTIVKGDNISNSIAASSIIAKTTRDRLMKIAHQYWPQWNFAQHKGYPTHAHREAIIQYGISPIHRASFLKKVLSPKPKKSLLTQSRRTVGQQGEARAESHLLAEGYRILGHNVRLGRGELDIVAEKGEFIVFVEVKTRTSSIIHPSLSVDSAKQAQLRKLGEMYLVKHKLWHKLQPRFDVITVQITPDKITLEHFINAC